MQGLKSLTPRGTQTSIVQPQWDNKLASWLHCAYFPNQNIRVPGLTDKNILTGKIGEHVWNWVCSKKSGCTIVVCRYHSGLLHPHQFPWSTQTLNIPHEASRYFKIKDLPFIQQISNEHEAGQTPSWHFLKNFYWSIVALHVVLVSVVQQCETAIRVHISPLFWISFPFRSPQSIE